MVKIRTTGRKSGAFRKKKAGRPVRKYVDSLAAKAWITHLIKTGNFDSAFAVGKKVYPGVYVARFDKYANGDVSPRDQVLKDTEALFPGSRVVFDSGPEGVELWDAIEGDYENLWRIIDPTCKDMAKYRQMRQTHRSRVEAIVNTLIETMNGNAFNLIAMRAPTGTNEVMCLHILQTGDSRQLVSEHLNRRDSPLLNAYMAHTEKVKINLTFSSLAALIAMWRLSMLVLDSFEELDYILSGLMPRAIPDLLEHYGVGEEVVGTLKLKRAAFLRWTELGHGKA